MDTRKIVDLLRGTIDPNQRAAAEEQLKQVTGDFILTFRFRTSY